MITILIYEKYLLPNKLKSSILAPVMQIQIIQAVCNDSYLLNYIPIWIQVQFQ